MQPWLSKSVMQVKSQYYLEPKVVSRSARLLCRLVQAPSQRQRRCPTLAQAPDRSSPRPRRPPRRARRPRPPAAPRTAGTAPAPAARAPSRAAQLSWPPAPPHTAAGRSRSVRQVTSQTGSCGLTRLPKPALPGEAVNASGLRPADGESPMVQDPGYAPNGLQPKLLCR